MDSISTTATPKTYQRGSCILGIEEVFLKLFECCIACRRPTAAISHALKLPAYCGVHRSMDLAVLLYNAYF
jgi:hypothetical protein